MLSLRPHRGFTLIELLIAFALIGILTVIAVPAFQHWIQNTQIRNGAEGILNGMQLARAEAVRRNVNVQLVMTTGSGWTIATAAAPTAILQSRVADEGSSSASVTISPGGATTITFNGLGTITGNADGSASITSIDVASATLSGTEIRPLRVVISTGGSPKMCDPAVASSDPRACP
jgi:type IV fimbrial biogenesis protein FimT